MKAFDTYGLRAPRRTAEASDAGGSPASSKGDVQVRVLINSLGEGDVVYAKGETFATTEERAAALGDSVEVVL